MRAPQVPRTRIYYLQVGGFYLLGLTCSGPLGFYILGLLYGSCTALDCVRITVSSSGRKVHFRAYIHVLRIYLLIHDARRILGQ